MINSDKKVEKTVFTNIEISPLVFDFYSSLRDIKQMDTVDSVYLNYESYKLEVYIYYEKENFDIEDAITKKIISFEENYKYFPEIYIYPLDMIDSKELTLPKTAREF